MALKSFTNHVRAWRDSIRRAVAILLLDRAPITSGNFEDAILFVRWDAKLGDTVVLSWVWRELKKHRPDLKLWVVTNQQFSDLFEKTYGFDKVVVSSNRPSMTKIFQTSHQLKRPRYVVHLSEALKARDLLFLRLIKPVHVVGLDDALKCIDIKLGAQTEGCHFSQKLVPLLQKLSVPDDDRGYWLPTNSLYKAEVMAYWKKDIVIGFCPFGASRHRSFSENKIIKILQKILASAEKLDLNVSVFVIATAEKEKGLIQLLEAHHLSSLVFLRPTTSLKVLFEQVRACVGIISVDTSVVHLAAGLCKPQLAIYKSPDKLLLDRSSNYLSWHPNSNMARSLFLENLMNLENKVIEDRELDIAIDWLVRKSSNYSRKLREHY